MCGLQPIASFVKLPLHIIYVKALFRRVGGVLANEGFLENIAFFLYFWKES